MFNRKAFRFALLSAVTLLFLFSASRQAFALASNNIPLDSPTYLYLEKLVGLGLISSDVKSIRPYSKAEVARLVDEAETNLDKLGDGASPFARELIEQVKKAVPREIALRAQPGTARTFDYNPLSEAKLRYVYLDGVARDYDRPIYMQGNQSAFGFIGGNLRPGDAGIGHQSGSEGTPMMENNEGVAYRQGSNGELSFGMEGFFKDQASVFVEPLALLNSDSTLLLQKGYAKLGGGGLELEVGRDDNWFGPGYRGTTTLSNNARNFDQIKLSSPEPVDLELVRRFLGETKYTLLFSRLDETGSGADLRHPYFYAFKLAFKPRDWFEWGIHFMRMEGGPGFNGSSTLQDEIFGGGNTNHNATTAGIDLRFQIPWLRNSELYGDYSGSDSALFWPIVESYVAGFYVPRLTDDGKNDLRFEFFYGNPKLYTDWKFPQGFVYHDMPFGDSQGGGVLEFFTRYSHWFSTRNNLALEYYHTDRGQEGKVDGQAMEALNAVRGFWNVPVYGDIDANCMYGLEYIHNFDLVGGQNRTNQVLRVDLNYKY